MKRKTMAFVAAACTVVLMATPAAATTYVRVDNQMYLNVIEDQCVAMGYFYSTSSRTVRTSAVNTCDYVGARANVVYHNTGTTGWTSWATSDYRAIAWHPANSTRLYSLHAADRYR